MTFSLSTNSSLSVRRSVWLAALLVLVASSGGELQAKPSANSTKGGAKSPETFLRQHNTYSNISFYFTNKGVLFNNDQVAGLSWPRGSGENYVFGGGLWFATKKEIQGRRRKLCELGYNPNSGSGWYSEGERSEVTTASDGASPSAKYISYLSPRYDKTTGRFISGSSSLVPSPGYPWPLWDTSNTKTFKKNFYLGDYISDVNQRTADKLSKNGRPAVPAMVSEEDIFNIYSDQNTINNPEFKPNNGYPFGLDIQEVIYSWSFGRYRDMIFLRHKVKNSSTDPLYDCWMAPAFDPDLGVPNNDRNSYVNDSLGRAAHAGLRPPYDSFPSKLNMGYQSSAQENGKEYGMIGFSFLESPVVDDAGNVIANDDSAALGGYGPTGLFQKKALGLKTFKKWTIKNDPSTQDLRYDFVSSGQLDLDLGIVEDMRLLFATGPFTLLPGKSVETVVAIGLARASTTDPNKNFQALLQQIDFAHQVFGEPVAVPNPNDSVPGYVINQFLSPVPPDLPNVKTQSLDRAVLVTWDSTSERSVDLLSPKSLPFLGYQLWRTTRSDRDSTIRPQGTNPNVLLGTWQLYDYRMDTIKVNGAVKGTRAVRLNSTPHDIPHSYLDFGDDNHDGQLTGSEGLTNGVKYYYYLIAYDELDTVNNIGPLFTAVVPPKNFVTEIPSKPPYLVQADSVLSGDLANNCLAGGVTKIKLDVADQGKFLQLFTNDTICVAFQERWNEQSDQFLNYSGLFNYVEVTDTRNNLKLDYRNLHRPSGTPSTEAYNFYSGIQLHVPGTVTTDSSYLGQFTTDRPAFAPNQLVDQTFRVLVDYQFDQLSTPYRLRSLTLTGNADPNIMHLSRRTNIGGHNQDIYHLDSNGTRPSFLGALGEVTYELNFGNPVTAPSPFVALDSSVFTPQVLPMTIKLVGCDAAVLRHTADSTEFTKMYNYRYYSHTIAQAPNFFAAFDDPDSMLVPIPGTFTMDAYHFTDDAALDQPHTGAVFAGYTSGPYYWTIKGDGNRVNNKSHLVAHRLRLAGAEIDFNAPGLAALDQISGDTVASNGPHMSDFQAGDKVTIPFTGLAKNLPFPGSCFRVITPGDSKVQLANAQNYSTDVLNQVQVVPNPYIVTHEGQTSTDNAKLYFTRLPPRATIEIYAIDGTLIKTLEHYGYVSTTTGSDPTDSKTTYDLNTLGDRSTVEEWNLLTEGKQRVGSQVLLARVISRDPQRGDAEVAETTTKFAVIVGGTRIR